MKEGHLMATTIPTQIRIDENTKKQAVELRDPNVKGYTDIDELFEELNS